MIQKYTVRFNPVTFEITKCLLDGKRVEIEKHGITTDEDWPTEDTMDILPIINESLERDRIPSGFEALKAIVNWAGSQDSVQVVKL